MNIVRLKITTTAPPNYADKIRTALGEAGAGRIGEYQFCSFSVIGKGRSMPTANANPFIGQPGKLEVIEEEQIEVVCARDNAKQVIDALREAHPYEEPIVEISPLLEEKDL